ncbi:SpvB/TcaC N-terminal domain-containing protein [Spirillospora sp. NPDC029432]|uniref:SpvB/TcaC N-terminal domain-containing protein n=1 Tax=Spirillospora sp. NPDC029432 TaxID=3154599 RepID=UPI00345360C2
MMGTPWTAAPARDEQVAKSALSNVLSVYGKDRRSRISDPADPRRVLSWPVRETRDDKGNGVAYEYKQEDGAGVRRDHDPPRNRRGLDDPSRTTNRYTQHLRYGNCVPLLDDDGGRPAVLADDGPEGAVQMSVQEVSEPSFDQMYDPNDQLGRYSVCNWELFFHTPGDDRGPPEQGRAAGRDGEARRRGTRAAAAKARDRHGPARPRRALPRLEGGRGEHRGPAARACGHVRPAAATSSSCSAVPSRPRPTGCATSGRPGRR